MLEFVLPWRSGWNAQRDHHSDRYDVLLESHGYRRSVARDGKVCAHRVLRPQHPRRMALEGQESRCGRIPQSGSLHEGRSERRESMSTAKLTSMSF